MNKPQHTLYAYVDGSDLAEIAATVESRWLELVGSGGWRLHPPIVVNQLHARTPELNANDLPGWDLGVNLDLPNPGEEPPGWFADVERIAKFSGVLYAEILRPIVIGVWDAQRRLPEDLFDVDSPDPNIGELKAVLGVADAR